MRYRRQAKCLDARLPSAPPLEIYFLPGDVLTYLDAFRLQHRGCAPLTARTTPRGYSCLRCRRCRAEVWERPHEHEKED